VTPGAQVDTFHSVFGIAPEARASAPGRVNLLGDHTDYNGGFVLPSPIPQQTTVEVGFGAEHDEVYSADLQEKIRFARSGPLHGFARYVGGCLRVLESNGAVIPALRLVVTSEVPLRAGLSSSAALEVATLRAVDALLGIGLGAVELAQLAQRAEVEHAGVSCGIMDQMASSLGRADMMLFLDTMTLEHRLLPLPSAAELLVVDSGVPRELANSPYNLRRKECAAAAEKIGVGLLREITDLNRVGELPHPLERRAKHVVSENARVTAATSADAQTFGKLMNESHSSLSVDFEVSAPAVDALVSFLQSRDAVFGARLTGAGFGGACVALVRAGTAGTVGGELLSWAAERQDMRPSIVVPTVREPLMQPAP
jgi:galactokinase